MKYLEMNKLWMVRAYYEDYDSSSWKIIGMFTDKKIADETKRKWNEFYLDKKSIFNEPKGWISEDLDETWSDSDEYAKRTIKYREIYNFKDIEVEEFSLNTELILGYPDTYEDLKNLMTQWDRNWKLEKIIK